MAGPELQKRAPIFFGWLNDGTVGVAGAFSSLCVMFSQFPSAQGDGRSKMQPFQSQRNGAAAVFALMQLSSIVRASSPRA